jgi:hypothetical protein
MYCWLVIYGSFVLREKYSWLVADKLYEDGTNFEIVASFTARVVLYYVVHVNTRIW